ncbi:MAG: pentapeptide repeat-containing protein [Alphaproteobacteria bacterium]
MKQAIKQTVLYTGLLLSFNAQAQEELLGDVASFWDIPLGVHALELDPTLFAEYACGTNGGPPSTLISGWAEYSQCPAEPETGLHEVQFRYDDEPEYWARANRAAPLILTFEGTKIFTVSVIISALFDEDGFLMGLRAVTDTRVSDEERLRSISLRNFIMPRYDIDAWVCEDLPRLEGETPFGTTYLKQRCVQATETLDLLTEARLYRKEGQYGINPGNNIAAAGLFESSVRFEMLLTTAIDDREERLADLAANPRQPNEAELNREIALDCPGCDLNGMNLKRQDLTGANLAGANLAGANLHGAILVGANLAGADLSGANLNRANLRQADLSGAILTDALLYAGVLDGADLSDADLTRAKAQESRMTRADLSNARVVAVDLTGALLSSVIAVNTNFGGTWLFDAQMRRGDFSGADFLQAILQRAILTEANLTDASFLGADLILANLRGANLTRTDFTAARLTMVNLANTNRDDALMEEAIDAPR